MEAEGRGILLLLLLLFVAVTVAHDDITDVSPVLSMAFLRAIPPSIHSGLW